MIEITFFQVLGTVAALFVSFWTLKWFQYSYQLRKFRGPPSFPLIGSCYDSGFLQIYKHLTNLRKKYGKIYSVFSFHKPLLVICDPVVVRRILSDPKTFFKGADYTESFHIVFGNGLVTSNGDDHKKGRALLGKYFIRSSVAKFTPNMNKIISKMIDQYLEPQMDSNPTGFAFNIEEFFARMALRNFMMFSCNVDCSVDPEFESTVCHLTSKGSFAAARVILFKEPRSRLFPNAKILMDWNDLVKGYFDRCIKEREARVANGEVIEDSLSELLKDQSISDQDRLDHWKTLIAAGHDTTAFFMSYLAYLLARNPAIQDKLVAYLKEKLGDKQEISADDFWELKYLQCVMMETLRMYAIIPVVTRECAEDVHIKEANIDIPKNITLLIPMIVMNKDPELWENPSEFNPSRFENKESADFTSAKDGFFPFAYGSRTCIGNTFAQVESAIAFIHILRQYKIVEKEGFRPKIMAGISLTTSNGIHIRLERR